MNSSFFETVRAWTTILALSSAATFSLATWVLAADEYNVVNGLTLTGNTLGLHGIDPVSMFDGNAPQIGDAVYTSSHDGKKLDGDQRYADIVDGKLHLFVNAAIFEKYLEDKVAVTAGASVKWPGMRTTPVEDI